MTSTENYESWDAKELAEYLKNSADLGQYYEVIIQQNIDGKTVGRLKDSDVTEMIPVIGDRLRFKEAIEKLQQSHREKKRSEELWHGEEVLFISCWDQACGTCCGCCPSDASTYSLTKNHMTIKTVNPKRCGPIRCCCGHEYSIDNIDLTHITSVDVEGTSPPCCQLIFCCGKTVDKVELKTTVEGDKIMTLPKGDGVPLSKKILNQIEEAQVMERD
mmetsp:Transcript_3472/g.5099  ORF Transcript_3472/g.5099 Transcript_3472/m.5099 type:complete len:217 (+) Transcript_3472:113-763(+)